MVNFKGLLVSAVLAGIFIVALLGFTINLGLDNRANHTILENPAISNIYREVQANLTNSTDTSKSQWEVLAGGEFSTFSDIGIVSTVKTAVSLPRIALSLFHSVFVLIGEVLGIPIVILYSLVTILIIVIIVGIISLIKAGR